MNNSALLWFSISNRKQKVTMKSNHFPIFIRFKSLFLGLILFSSLFISSAFAQSITVQSPNGGEIWTYGTYETATWTGQNLSGVVTIEFSYDGGVNWLYFGAVTTGPNGGSTAVSPPNTSTTNAILRISDYTNPEVSDVSDAPFTNFVPSIIILQPYYGMDLFIGELVYVNWMLNANGINLLNVEISIDNGQTFTLIAENINANSNYTYLELSEIPSEACILKLYDAENPTNVGLSDAFSINPVPVYTITSPAEGEIINTISPFTISWNVEDPFSSYCFLEYSIDNGANWVVIDNAVNIGNSGSYVWITPIANSEECLIRISDGYATSAVDFSELFTIFTFPETPICMVSVDSLTNYNVIIWEKPETDMITDFLVYKETDQSDVYEVIDTVSYEEAPMLTDIGSNPAIRPYRYKIGFLDDENRVFPAGDYHQTIHLTINQGVNDNWNLIWTSYEGFDYSSYYIVRKSGSGIYEDIAIVSASFNSYTDFDAPSGDISYMVKIVHPTGCDFTLRDTGYPEVYSNVASNALVNVSENTDFNFTVYPNPANDFINITFSDKVNGQVNVVLTDLAGREIYSMDFSDVNSGQMKSISSKNFEEGMYLLHLRSGEKMNTAKIVIRH
jgi:hypothetical protein